MCCVLFTSAAKVYRANEQWWFVAAWPRPRTLCYARACVLALKIHKSNNNSTQHHRRMDWWRLARREARHTAHRTVASASRNTEITRNTNKTDYHGHSEHRTSERRLDEATKERARVRREFRVCVFFGLRAPACVCYLRSRKRSRLSPLNATTVTGGK